LQLDEQKSTINEQRLQLEAALQRIKELEGLS
jgi:hypothetical protein